MGPSRLRLDRKLLDRIRRAAVAAYPYECCGLLVGVIESETLWRATRIAESANLAAPARRDRFEVDPAIQFALMRELRGGPEAIVGVYHSHPDGVPRPSRFDLERAYDPSLVSVIAAVTAGAISAIKAFRIDDRGGFEEIAIEG